MFEIHAKANNLLMISIACYLGVIVPFPFAPVAFVMSIAVIIMGRQLLDRAVYEGALEDTCNKIRFAMVLSFGYILTALMFLAMIVFCLIVIGIDLYSKGFKVSLN